MRCNRFTAIFLTIGWLLLATNALAQRKPERIQFQKGHISTTIKGRVVSYNAKDYLLGAAKGQTMTIRLDSTEAYFVVFPAKGEPIEMGPRKEWSEILFDSGDYVVRVFMMRAVTRRKGANANYTLKIEIK
jgi:hypothetical protein